MQHTIEQYLNWLGNRFIHQLEIPDDYLYSERIQKSLKNNKWSLYESGIPGWHIIVRLNTGRPIYL